MRKSILITGSTDGIGKIAAKLLAKDGHKIYIHGRNSKKLDKTIKEIEQFSGNHDIDGFVADFSDLSAVSKLASQINKSLPKLDVLINNAGVYKSSLTKTAQGLDVRFTVNYLAPCLLTHDILPILQKGDAPRVINLSSAAQTSVEIKALEGVSTLAENEAYAQSKLALTMWSFNFANENNEIVTIALNPGSLLNTRMVQEAFGKHWSSADKGGNIIYELAISPQYKADSGKYFDNDKGDLRGEFAMAHQDAYDENIISRLMETTYGLLKE